MSTPGPVTIEFVKTRFGEMAVTPSPISRAEALSRAKDAVAALLPQAEIWLCQDLDALAVLLERMQRPGGPEGDEMQRAYLLACSVRDSSGQFGKNGMTIVANSFCELISRMREAGTYHHLAMATHLDAIKLVAKVGLTGMPDDALETLSRNLLQLVNLFPNPDDALRAKQAENKRKWEEKQKLAAQA